ncbi:formylglycine-generating enzyme family protein [Niabella beijingensis]|uniref:formylglycine-generating enzyme family protein n=1 Tax=Niabella beijingensis TaxID=2872700 RepID=UPI001CBB1D18|nr:SUMF1/EgtB/PvdO family nonheme iron enzyme [Niabella beijingensis]MBZ4188848.1 formylglycine-generating enzyme family protein [Niabella beijingensis]
MNLIFQIKSCIYIALLGGSFTAAAQQFVLIPPGSYPVGMSGSVENPPRRVITKGFRIATTELTNAAFEKFITATGYITEAERFKNGLVFEPGLEEFRWITDSTAYWRYPNGSSRGGIENKMDHPVTGISFTDALAYCKWAGVRLPTLDEWEIAARAGSSTKYFKGVTDATISRYANIWQGPDHLQADSTDGFMYTAPVAHFKPNPLGLYDVLGNVFEFCSGTLPRDKGRKVAHARGGSWWCSKNACNFFNTVDIGSVNPHASFSNLGFRVVKEPGGADQMQ